MTARARTAKAAKQPWQPRWCVAALYRRLRRRFRKVPGLNEGFVIKD